MGGGGGLAIVHIFRGPTENEHFTLKKSNLPDWHKPLNPSMIATFKKRMPTFSPLNQQLVSCHDGVQITENYNTSRNAYFLDA